MSKLRAVGTRNSNDPALADDTALFLICRSVSRRRSLIHGRLKDGEGHYCAIGAFWEDHPGTTLHTALIDEVAAVNDSVPLSATAKERWKTVNSWLRFKLASLSGRTK